MNWAGWIIAGILIIVWAYVLARMVTRAIIRTLKEEQQDG